MINAYLFDFNETLISSPAWMTLEISGLPKQAFDLLANQGHIDALNDDQSKVAENSFKNTRKLAEETEQESSHLDDLAAMVMALGMENHISQKLIEKTVATLHMNCVSKVTLIEGVVETIQGLSGQGHPLGIISNAAYSPFLKWTLDHFEILNFFDEIIVSADVGIRKPKTGIFDIALERMKLEAGNTAYVGDDFEKDVIGANQTGLLSIWFNPHNHPLPSHSKEAPYANIGDFRDILGLDQAPV